MKAYQFLFLTLVFLIVGCSSSSKKGSTDKHIQKYESELEDVSFKDAKQELVKYNQKEFTYKDLKEKYFSAIESESLNRIFFETNYKKEEETVLFDLALSCYKKDFEKMKDLVRANSKGYEKHPGLWNQIGVCYLLQKQSRKALLFFNKALALDSNFVPSLNNIAYIYHFRKNDQKALAAIERALKASSKVNTPNLNMAYLLVAYDVHDEARSVLNSLHKNNENDIDLNNLLGISYLAEGDYKSSLKYFENIDDDFFEKPEYGLNYVINLIKLGKKEEADKVFSKIEVSKRSPYRILHKSVKALLKEKG